MFVFFSQNEDYISNPLQAGGSGDAERNPKVSGPHLLLGPQSQVATVWSYVVTVWSDKIRKARQGKK